MTHQYLGDHKPTTDPAEALALKYNLKDELAAEMDAEFGGDEDCIYGNDES